MQECVNMHLIMLVSRAFVHVHSTYSEEEKNMKEG